MSSTLQKIADKLTGKDKEHDNPQSSNYGPHSSAAANKLDPKVDSDLDGRNNPTSRVGGYGNTQANDNYGSTTGPGGITSSDTYGSSANNPGYNNPSSAAYGPHSSNIANKLDPRVDSDRDGRNDPTSNLGGRGHTQNANDRFGQATGPGGIGSTDTGYDAHSTTTTGYHGHGTHTTTGGVIGTGGNLHDTNHSTNAGPHSSNLLNKLDPRVDSDLDGRKHPTSRTGGYGQSQPGLEQSTFTTGGTGQTMNAYAHGGAHQTTQATNAGPHSSNLLNKLDPRVDSDRDGSNNPLAHSAAHGQTHSGTGVVGSTGYGSTTGNTASHTPGYTGTNITQDDPRSTNTGPHSSNLLNKLDPRVDSDRDGRNDPTSRTGGYGQTQTGTGGIQRY